MKGHPLNGSADKNLTSQGINPFLSFYYEVQGSTYRRALGLVKYGLTYREWRENWIEAGGIAFICPSGRPTIKGPFFPPFFGQIDCLIPFAI